MSTLFVDTINEKTSGNGIQIPGHPVQIISNNITPASSALTTQTWTDTGIPAITLTTKAASSKILLSVQGCRWEIPAATDDRGIAYTFFVSKDSGSSYDHLTTENGDAANAQHQFLQFEYRTDSDGNVNIQGAMNFKYVFSPSVAAGTRYDFKVYARGWNTGSVNPTKSDAAGAQGNFTVMEIAQ